MIIYGIDGKKRFQVFYDHIRSRKGGFYGKKSYNHEGGKTKWTKAYL
jgi:hypothetical protein